MTHSFPTLRSSDLAMQGPGGVGSESPVRCEGRQACGPLRMRCPGPLALRCAAWRAVSPLHSGMQRRSVVPPALRQQAFRPAWLRCRSEEHTSELQSLMRISYAVFCLKKKTHSHKKEQNTY